MNKVALDDDIKAEGLSILGDLPVSPSDPVPEGTQSILMLGPDEPNFWNIFKDSREYKDKKPDPLDRWSKRIIDNIAKKNNCAPLYPLWWRALQTVLFLGPQIWNGLVITSAFSSSQR